MKYLLAIFPSAGVLFLFWLAIKSIVEADRRERAAEAKYQRTRKKDQGRPRRAAPGNSAGDSAAQSRDHD